MWCLGHGCRVTDRFSRGAAPDDHVRGCSCWVMGRSSQVAARNGKGWGRNRRAARRVSQDMAYDSRGWGCSRRAAERFSQDTTSGVGDWGMAVGQWDGPRRWRPATAGLGAQPLGNGPVLTGKSPFNHMADHYGVPFQVIQYLQTKVVSNHKGSIPPHSCRPAHRPVRITDDRSSSAPRQS